MPVSPKHGRQTPDDHEVDHVEPNVAFLAGQYNHKEYDSSLFSCFSFSLDRELVKD